MGALNLPSAADIERLTRRLRSVSLRLEGIEDGVDRLDRALAPGRRRPPGDRRSACPRSRPSCKRLTDRLDSDGGAARDSRPQSLRIG